MIYAKDIAKALISLTEEDEINPEEVVEKFMIFARRYNIENRIESVIFHLEAELARKNEKNKAFITLAQPTSEESLGKIKQTLGAEKAEVALEYDEKLIAGFRAYYKDKLYEANVGGALNDLKKALKTP